MFWPILCVILLYSILFIFGYQPHLNQIRQNIKSIFFYIIILIYFQSGDESFEIVADSCDGDRDNIIEIKNFKIYFNFQCVCRFYLIFLWLYIFFYKSVNLLQGVVTLRPKTFLSNTKKHWGGGQLKILVSFLSGNVPEFHCFKKISIFSMEFFFQE